MIIPHFNFPIYGLIIVLSLIIGMGYIILFLKKEKVLEKNVYLYFLMYFAFAFFFGKMFTVFTSCGDIDFLEAGLSSYGGLIGVILSAFIFEKIIPLKGKLIKYVILSLPLTYGISKLACFFGGCCFGIPYDGIFSVTYSDGLNIPLFPVQLFETIISLGIFFLCHCTKNKENVLYMTIIFIAFAKFMFEYLRYDHMNVFLNANQIFSIILLVIIIIYWLLRKKVLK